MGFLAEEIVRFFLCLVLLPCVSLASQPRYTLPTVPTTQIDGVDCKCLNTDQWRQVLLMANAYKGLYDWRLKIEGTLEAHAKVITAYELQIKNYKNILTLKDNHIDYLKDNVKQLEKRHRNTRLEDRIQKYVLWAVVLAETVIIGIISLRGAPNG